MSTRLLPALGFVLLAASVVQAAHYGRTVFGPVGTPATSVVIPLDGSSGEEDLNPSTRVSGTCRVEQVNSVGPGGSYSFTCGVDRDDDMLVTNFDFSTSDARGFDDDFASGFGSVAVCFREDLDSGFDDVQVMLRTNTPPPAVGAFRIDVTLNDNIGCTPSGP